jgi:lipoprotein-releasing system ATP-binding protein
MPVIAKKIMIEAEAIHKSFDGLHVLKGVSLAVRRGEVVSIVGASGAGKTTLLQILGTLDAADSGSVRYDGRDVTRLAPRPLAAFRNKHIGFVFQFHHLLPEFTAAENVAMPLFIAGTGRAEALRRAAETLGYLGLGARRDHKPQELSGGEQQRVAVARALVHRPDAVLADEPSGNLDSANAAELHKLFFRLRDDFSLTFVIVTHNEDLAAMADRRLVMKDGVIGK